MLRLHDFDRRLCDYVRFNIQEHDDNPYLMQQLTKLDPPLAAYIRGGKPEHDGDSVALLLNYDELSDLAAVAEYPRISRSRLSAPCTTGLEWTPLAVLHRRSTLCTAEIKRLLAPAEARRWAEHSGKFTAHLEKRGLLLSEGIEIVGAWLVELRRYLDAMGEYALIPAPDGHFPTPTHPTPTVPPDHTAGDPGGIDRYVERMLRAIEETPNGRQASPEALRKHAKANKRKAIEALRILEKQGKYEGFKRETPPRYRKPKAQ